MRYLKLFESFEDIEQICKQYNIKNYTINTDDPSIIMGRLNDFLLTIGEDPVEKVEGYKNI